MNTVSISTKEIRNDLEGFLRKLKSGRVMQVMYRSKLLVTVAAAKGSDVYLAEDAGTPAAARRSIEFVQKLPNKKSTFAPDKSFKELYNETR